MIYFDLVQFLLWLFLYEQDIQHKNVIKYYNSWVDREREQIVFITEIMSSGSLKE